MVGTALVESGFGRETPFSAERGLSSKVFPLPKGYLKSSMAAAAGEENDGKDNEPNPVVVKQLAEAVVVHNEPPK